MFQECSCWMSRNGAMHMFFSDTKQKRAWKFLRIHFLILFWKTEREKLFFVSLGSIFHILVPDFILLIPYSFVRMFSRAKWLPLYRYTNKSVTVITSQLQCNHCRLQIKQVLLKPPTTDPATTDQPTHRPLPTYPQTHRPLTH